MKPKYEILNKEQKYIIDNILDEINTVIDIGFDGRKITNIIGPAGCGKSFTTSVLINKLKRKYKIVVTAPTHKALAVLSDMVDDKSIPVKTIYSFLSLKLKKDYKTGKTYLEQDFKKEINKCDVLFIDESSMVSDEIYTIIQNTIDRGHVKCVIFCGDACQLLPVESDVNPVYENNNPYPLSKIVRQAEDNTIIHVATHIRKMIETENYDNIEILKNYFKTLDYSNIKLVNEFNDFFSHYHKNATEDNSLICAFKNETVNHYNNIARLIHKGENLPYILKNEKLIFLESHVENEEIIHMNNEVVEIKDCMLQFDEERKIKYWQCIDTDEKLFKVVDIESMQDWNKYLNYLSYSAKSADPEDRRNLWTRFFSEKERYQSVAYTYASTLHKSQGSSIDNVYINLDEIFDASRYIGLDMVYRLLYVGITRARENVILYLK